MFWGVADSFDAVAVGVEHERTVVACMVLRPQARSTVIATAAGQRRVVKRDDGIAIARQETDMHAARRHNAGLLSDREFDSERGGRAAVVGAPAFKIDNPHQPKWPQRRIIEALAASEIMDAERDVVDHERGLPSIGQADAASIIVLRSVRATSSPIP